MPSPSFIEFVFPQFIPENWRAGISIYRAAGVTNLQIYGEMVSARVRAGIGESYDVRLKLHGGGKYIQWMECTCQPYRRRSEKCPHIASLCIYLDQDQSLLLNKLNMTAGKSDKYLIADELNVSKFFNDSNDPKISEKTQRTLQKVEPTKPIEKDYDWLAEIRSPKNGTVVGLDIDDDPPTLLVTMQIEKKKLTYRLGVDDAWRVLKDDDFFSLMTKKNQEILSDGYTAKRIFDIERHKKDGLKIDRVVVVSDKEGVEKKKFLVSEVRASALGKQAFFSPKFAFVPFTDNLSPAQVARWEEYPKTAVVDTETAGHLFQTKFLRLRESAETRLSKDLQSLGVFDKVVIPELKLKSTLDGFFIVDPMLAEGGQTTGAGGEAGTSKRSKRTAENSLLSILKARAEGKQYIVTPTGWLKVGDEFDWLRDKVSPDGKLKLNTLELIKFREQFAADAEISGAGQAVNRIKQGLISANDLDLPNLEHTKLTLRPYQIEGVKWLWWLYKNQLGGLLADEMGLGKTHQAMALLASVALEQPKKLSLVVCPTTVIDHWLAKMRNFVPDSKIVLYHGPSRRGEDYRNPKEHKIIVTSYGILLRDVDFFMQCPWAVIVLDEAHVVKNHSTRTYRAACKLPSQMRLCLTGTPLENDLMELKNLFDYIVPSYLGTDAEFKRRYMTPIEGSNAAVAELELRRMIHPFKMRRNKKDVLSDLPEKVEDIRYCHLNRDQLRLYSEALALKGAALVDVLQANDSPIPYIHIFSVISLLKQICDDPALIDPRYEDMGSGKLDVLDELISEALESDQKIVIFTQYAKMVARLSRRFNAQGIKHVTLTGSTQNRGAVVQEFQENHEVKIFIGSLLAGGTGIDLTSASMVIHFDRWWNAAKEDQATDRIHRIGQMRNVQVYKLVTKGTLEERIDEVIERKKIIFERFVEQDNEVFKHLSREDLLSLLAPPSDDTRVEENELPDR